MTPSDVSNALSEQGYLPDDGISTSVFLAMTLERPLLLEGEAGVGKTELAKALSAATGGELIRLQCYEGIDVAQAVYDWDYARQLLHLRAAEATGETASMTSDALEAELYSERFMIKRALLRAIETVDGPPPVLLIDEVDRADDEFEAYLLEILSDFQVTVPEVGVFRAERAAAGRAHLEPHPRRARCAQAALPLPLGRTPGVRAGGRDREAAGPRGRRRPGPPGRRRGRGPARAQPLQAARRRRDHRLGQRTRTPRRDPARRSSWWPTPSARC